MCVYEIIRLEIVSKSRFLLGLWTLSPNSLCLLSLGLVDHMDVEALAGVGEGK